MRSFILVSLSTLTLAACTVEHTTSAPDTADGGAPKTHGKKIPLGGGTKDAGTKPTGPKTCRDAALCLGDCKDGDDTCQDKCLVALPDAEMSALNAVAVCIQQSGCEDDDCISQTCATEINACAN